MSESAPLNSAYSHARKAADQTAQIKWSDAASEHGQAAAEYVKASRGTSDHEALRILKLLEEQHRRLESIIKFQAEHEPAAEDSGGDVSNVESSPPRGASSAVDSPSSGSSRPRTALATASSNAKTQVRDSSPSLARDMASRRGIPPSIKSTPSAAAQARARQLSPDSQRKTRGQPGRPATTAPPSVIQSQRLRPQSRAREEDDSFSKFYENITSGTMSRLSSVLAYAGLPLTADDIPPERSTMQRSRHTVPASNDPDVKKIFSKAALTAIEEEQRRRGARGHMFGPAESFYVVQKGGGTYSYADIAKAQQQQAAGGMDTEDEEAFVDAREKLVPQSPTRVRHTGVQPRTNSTTGRTHEELELENVTLKQTLEQVATRLAEFEAHAQDATMAALTQSMIGAHGPNLSADQIRVKQLEEQLELKARENEQLQARAHKQDKYIRSAKAQWETLVEKAKEKDKAKRERSGGTSADAGSKP